KISLNGWPFGLAPACRKKSSLIFRRPGAEKPTRLGRGFRLFMMSPFVVGSFSTAHRDPLKGDFESRLCDVYSATSAVPLGRFIPSMPGTVCDMGSQRSSVVRALGKSGPR